MNDLITRLAREAGIKICLSPYGLDGKFQTVATARGDALERFVALVAEECAFMCDQMFNRAATADECADAIRAKFGSKG